MGTLYTDSPWPRGPFDSTAQVHTGTGKLKMTSVLQGSHCKSPFLHANFLSVSFYLPLPLIALFFFFARAWRDLMDFPPTFPARLERRRKKTCFSQQVA